MKETINQMRERHEAEIEQLQATCKHKAISDWMPFEWAPAHRDGEARACLVCGTIVERRGTIMQLTNPVKEDTKCTDYSES